MCVCPVSKQHAWVMDHHTFALNASLFGHGWLTKAFFLSSLLHQSFQQEQRMKKKIRYIISRLMWHHSDHLRYETQRF